jgi:uncharacterized protein YfbU (UPF0304 family)
VKLTNSEKLILTMLCDIYKHLEVRSEIEPKFVQQAIATGNTWGLEEKYRWIFGEHDTSRSVVTEVADILDMWSLIESAYSTVPAPDKKNVKLESAPSSERVKFPGFDANNEAEYLGVARFFVDQLGKWSIFKDRDLNSRCRSIDTYRRMLAVFEPIRAKLSLAGMSSKDLLDVLKAMSRPEHRGN